MTELMSPSGYAAHLAVEGLQLTEIAADATKHPAKLTLAVPTCPGWTLEDLLGHCAGVFTFVGRSIEAGGPIDRASIGPGEGGLAEWISDAFEHMVSELNSRKAGQETWSFDPNNQTVDFWWRRMAHEAVLHRWDAETALGVEPWSIDPLLAVDGVNELLDFFVPQRNPTAFAGSGETMHLHTLDAHGEWVITRTPEGMVTERAHAKADVAARGPAEQILLFVWGRVGPDELETFGEVELLDQWQREVRF